VLRSFLYQGDLNICVNKLWVVRQHHLSLLVTVTVAAAGKQPVICEVRCKTLLTYSVAFVVLCTALVFSAVVSGDIFSLTAPYKCIYLLISLHTALTAVSQRDHGNVVLVVLHNAGCDDSQRPPADVWRGVVGRDHGGARQRPLTTVRWWWQPHAATIGDRAFAVATPSAWNSLPGSLHKLSSLNNSKSHLFRISQTRCGSSCFGDYRVFSKEHRLVFFYILRNEKEMKFQQM